MDALKWKINMMNKMLDKEQKPAYVGSLLPKLEIDLLTFFFA